MKTVTNAGVAAAMTRCDTFILTNPPRLVKPNPPQVDYRGSMPSTRRLLPPGFAPVPHSFWTILGRKVSGYAQHFAIGYIFDRTLGVPDKPLWTKLNSRTLARLTGLEARAFDLALADGVERGLIRRKRPNCDCGPRDLCECTGREWMYSTNESEWTKIPDWKRRQLARPEESEPDAETVEEETQTAAGEPHKPDERRIIVAPGKAARPVVLSVTIKDAPPVDMRLQPENKTGYPLSFQASVGRDSMIRLAIFDGAERRTNGEPLRTGVRNRSSQVVDKNRSASLGNALTRLLREWFQKPLDAGLEGRVAAALPSAPVDGFEAFATKELESSRRRRRTHTSGILEAFAAQFQKSYDDEAAERAAEEMREKRLLARMVAHGYSENEAASQLNLWRKSRWDVEAQLAKLELLKTENAAKGARQ